MNVIDISMVMSGWLESALLITHTDTFIASTAHGAQASLPMRYKQEKSSDATLRCP
jgi:hypothetical protein